MGESGRLGVLQAGSRQTGDCRGRHPVHVRSCTNQSTGDAFQGVIRYHPGTKANAADHEMPSKYTLNVSVTEHLHSFVAAQIASGRFYTASEVVRAALRRLERELEGNDVAANPRHGKAGPVAATAPPQTLPADPT